MSHVVITVDIEFKSSDAASVAGLRVVVETISSSSSSNAFCRPYINLSHNNIDRFRSRCRFRSFGIYGMKRCILQIFMSKYQFLVSTNMIYQICQTIKLLPYESTLLILRSKQHQQEMLMLGFRNLPWSKEENRARTMLFR